MSDFWAQHSKQSLKDRNSISFYSAAAVYVFFVSSTEFENKGFIHFTTLEHPVSFNYHIIGEAQFCKNQDDP